MTEQDIHKTKVVFRKFPDGEVIALFYEEEFSHPGNFTSYMHVGQHGQADVTTVWITKLATPEEYADLKEELESIGYNLDIRKKIQRR